MSDISTDLYNRIRQALSVNNHFDSDRQLRILFDDVRLIPWHSNLQRAETLSERVDATIALLRNRWHANGENALVLFLEVLSERIHPQDAQYQQILTILEELKSTLTDAGATSLLRLTSNPTDAAPKMIATSSADQGAARTSGQPVFGFQPKGEVALSMPIDLLFEKVGERQGEVSEGCA